MDKLSGRTDYPEVNGATRARKVKANTHVAINKNSDPVQKFFLRGGWGGQCPNSIFSKTSGIVRNESS